MDNFSRLTTMVKGRKKIKKAVLRDKGHKSEMNILIETIKDHKPMPISFESLYATTLATFKIHESIERQNSVKI